MEALARGGRSRTGRRGRARAESPCAPPSTICTRKRVRSLILDDRRRVDGRGLTDIRPLSAEVDLSPRAHGSGLFTRGETQVLTLATLGTPRERQELDGLSPVDEKRYMHHYNFPPVLDRRDRGRCAARRAARSGTARWPSAPSCRCCPSEDEFPYTLRLVSEVLSSNGSTSMASVCGSTLALLDTGVPIKAPVAGIAMGLIKEGERYAVLTDIQGDRRPPGGHGLQGGRHAGRASPPCRWTSRSRASRRRSWPRRWSRRAWPG